MRDQTTGSKLYHWDSPSGPPMPPGTVLDLSFWVDPSHTYRLEAALSVRGVDDGHTWHSYMQGEVIPAPGALILASLGLAGIRWLRRRGSL